MESKSKPVQNRMKKLDLSQGQQNLGNRLAISSCERGTVKAKVFEEI